MIYLTILAKTAVSFIWDLLGLKSRTTVPLSKFLEFNIDDIQEAKYVSKKDYVLLREILLDLDILGKYLRSMDDTNEFISMYLGYIYHHEDTIVLKTSMGEVTLAFEDLRGTMISYCGATSTYKNWYCHKDGLMLPLYKWLKSL